MHVLTNSLVFRPPFTNLEEVTHAFMDLAKTQIEVTILLALPKKTSFKF